MEHAEAVMRRLLAMRVQILGLLRALVHPDLVEDAFQETVLAVMRSAARYDPQRPFEPWARGVARTIARRIGRLRGRESTLDSEILEARVTQAMDEHGDAAAEAADHLEQCLERVPEHQRRLVDLHYGAGLAHAAIAEREGKTPGAVQVALSRIRAALAECMQNRGLRA